MAARPKKSPRSNPRARRILTWVLLSLVTILVAAVVGLLVWANVGVMQAEPGPLAVVQANPAISITDYSDSVVLAPTGEASGSGLIFIPGAKVDPNAYLYKLSGAVEETGVTVVVTKPILNLAFFDLRALTTFTDHVPGISTWSVGGHSLGGVRACQYGEQPDVSGLVLFGSYCANDLSNTKMRVLSLSGSDDGLSTPQKIRESSHLLPPGTIFFQIDGANHASFGDYGAQPGDGTASLSSPTVRSIITEHLTDFFAAG
ncbi:alpha/beta hydrolase [Homoserinimonas sp. OAct 916]|uniref:alpha/beta hydrolase n=1 Tax=Homoserinimonas sp. OAct 916 TaxID=2211450 RepID=UPI000DBE2DBE|nr:alpha/beta hydrolase [Homoserinimonas sp. OAct 916]